MALADFPKSVEFDAPELHFDPDAPYTQEYTPGINDDAVRQVRPVPDAMRALVGPLTLPGTLTGSFDKSRGGRPRFVRLDLDPELNNGYTSASFHTYYYPNRGGFDASVKRPGDYRSARLSACPKCASPWCRHTDEAYGWATDCEVESCRYHFYVSMGDLPMITDLPAPQRDAMMAMLSLHWQKRGWLSLPMIAKHMGLTGPKVAPSITALIGRGYARSSAGGGHAIYRLTEEGVNAAEALAGPPATEEQIRDLAGTMAAQLAAIADGKLVGPRRAALRLLAGNLDRLLAWQDRADAAPVSAEASDG
jgi:DNA-binding MarR family transcriptional regulator